jgi:hypothetical protein
MEMHGQTEREGVIADHGPSRLIIRILVWPYPVIGPRAR